MGGPCSAVGGGGTAVGVGWATPTPRLPPLPLCIDTYLLSLLIPPSPILTKSLGYKSVHQQYFLSLH